MSANKGLSITVTNVRGGYVVTKKRDGRIVRQSHVLGKPAADSLARDWRE